MDSENLIKKLEICDYCRCEKMLTDAQRNREVLKKPIPENHIHRELVEQICGKQYDGVCEMKYAMERINCNERVAAQNVCVEMYSYDLAKKFNRPISFEESSKFWSKEIEYQGKRIKSKAEKYEEIWNLGLREGILDTNRKKKERQSLSIWYIYEIIVAPEETYQLAVKLQKKLQNEHKKRDSIEMLVA